MKIRNRCGVWACVVLIAGLLIAPGVYAQRNDIMGFKVVNESPHHLVLEVWYSYSGNRGRNVLIGARSPKSGISGFSYRPNKCSKGEHRVRVSFGFDSGKNTPYQFTTENLYLTMYVGGKRSFLQKTFNHRKTWRIPRIVKAVACERIVDGEPRGFPMRGKANLAWWPDQVCRHITLDNVRGTHEVYLKAYRDHKYQSTTKTYRFQNPRNLQWLVWFCGKRGKGSWDEYIYIDGWSIGSMWYDVGIGPSVGY